MHFINTMIQNRSVNAKDSHHMMEWTDLGGRGVAYHENSLQGHEALDFHNTYAILWNNMSALQRKKKRF